MIEEVTGSILEILAHPIRRGIICMMGSSSALEGISYTELLTELQISTGRLNYHLRQMEGYLMKNDSYRYILTPLGKKAHEALNIVRQSAGSDPELTKYYKPMTKKSTFVGLVKSMSWILIAAVCLPIFLVSITIAESMGFRVGVLIFVFIYNALVFVIPVAFTVWLLFALRYAPELARKIEEKLYG